MEDNPRGKPIYSPCRISICPIEGEALAVAEALDRARYFVLGCDNLIIAVDHKPLLKIFTDRSFEDIANPRLRNLKKTFRYRFSMVHIPGKNHFTPDALSRHPTGEKIPKRMYLQDEMSAITNELTEIPHPLYTFEFINSLLSGTRCAEQNSNTIEDEIKTSATNALESIQSVTWDKVQVATNSDEDS